MDRFVDGFSQVEGQAEENVDFTINPFHGAERFLEFQGKEVTYCLLRIFQGLIRAGTTSVRVKVLKSRTVLEAEGVEIPCKPEILGRVLQARQRDPYLKHIREGILAACHESVEQLDFELQGKLLRVKDRKLVLGVAAEFTNFLRITCKHGRRGWLDSGAIDHITLGNKLRYAPVPVTIDRMPLTPKPPPDPAYFRWYRRLSRPQLLAHITGERSESSALVQLDRHNFLAKNSAGSSFYVLFNPECVFFLDLALKECYELTPVIDGVVSESVKSKRFPGLQGFQHTGCLQTTPCGLKVKENEEFCRLVESHYRQSLVALLPLLEHLQAVWPKNFNLEASISFTGDLAGELTESTLGSVAATTAAGTATALVGGSYQMFDFVISKMQKRIRRKKLIKGTDERIRAILGSLDQAP